VAVLRAALASLAAAAVTAGAAVAPAQAASPPTRGVALVNTNLGLVDSSGAGSGIVLSKTGEVLTNNHVIRGATTIKVKIPSSGRTYSATVLGYSIVDDVALLKLQGASNLATATRGNSAKLNVGQSARAVGNANGGGKLVVTTGRVTGINETISVRDDNGQVARLGGLIETSARLVPGDSGGALIDSAGRVIGMNAAGSPSFAFSTTTLGYAIPINRALTIAGQIRSKRSSSTVHVGATAFIGLSVDDAEAGVVIDSIVPDSPAAQAGLQPGYVLTALDGAPIRSFTDLRGLLFTKHPGDTITLDYTDALGNRTSTPIVLATGPPQ
jgi:S1-C subfamily serine protease